MDSPLSSTSGVNVLTSEGSNVKFEAVREFDLKRMRHYLNGTQTVLHCHHYASLFTQLACDAEHLNGPALLSEAAAETFYPILKDYYINNHILEFSDRISIAEQYFAYIGLGDLRFEFAPGRGTAILRHSHIDEGWLKKWGANPERVNFIGEGFIGAACAAIFDLRIDAEIAVKETQSIVMGASRSKFEIKWQGHYAG
jgi:hypothetical protein